MAFVFDCKRRCRSGHSRVKNVAAGQGLWNYLSKTTRIHVKNWWRSSPPGTTWQLLVRMLDSEWRVKVHHVHAHGNTSSLAPQCCFKYIALLEIGQREGADKLQIYPSSRISCCTLADLSQENLNRFFCYWKFSLTKKKITGLGLEYMDTGSPSQTDFWCPIRRLQFVQ